MVRMLAEVAPAKINLFLRVVGRRADGYHLLDSLFVPISLHDQVKIELRDGASGTPGVALRCDAALGPDEENLAVRAARGFIEEFALRESVAIELKKQIPAGAGLGGGSSDAGAVLRMMATLTRMGERADASRLHRLALQLGADVPFFLDPRPARVTGVGEQIEPLEGFARMALVIAVPPLPVSTAEVFRALKEEQWSGPATPDEVAALSRGELKAGALVNDLAAVAMGRFPWIARLKALLETVGARRAAMSGSGGAVFGIFDSDDHARDAAAAVKGMAPEATVIAASAPPHGAP